jgi:hypothetical protein
LRFVNSLPGTVNPLNDSRSYFSYKHVDEQGVPITFSRFKTEFQHLVLVQTGIFFDKAPREKFNALVPAKQKQILQDLRLKAAELKMEVEIPEPFDRILITDSIPLSDLTQEVDRADSSLRRAYVNVYANFHVMGSTFYRLLREASGETPVSPTPPSESDPDKGASPR